MPRIHDVVNARKNWAGHRESLIDSHTAATAAWRGGSQKGKKFEKRACQQGLAYHAAVIARWRRQFEPGRTGSNDGMKNG